MASQYDILDTQPRHKACVFESCQTCIIESRSTCYPAHLFSVLQSNYLYPFSIDCRLNPSSQTFVVKRRIFCLSVSKARPYTCSVRISGSLHCRTALYRKTSNTSAGQFTIATFLLMSFARPAAIFGECLYRRVS